MQIKVKRKNVSLTLDAPDGEKIPLQDLLCDLERSTIESLVASHDGIKARAADLLMMNRTTLVEKAKKYGLPIIKRRS